MVQDLKYGIPVSDFNNVIAILKENTRIEQAILFGSRAKGTYSNGSDVDIALLGKDLKLGDILEASEDIEKLFLPWKFDLVIFSRIKEQALKEHINRVGIELF